MSQTKDPVEQLLAQMEDTMQEMDAHPPDLSLNISDATSDSDDVNIPPTPEEDDVVPLSAVSQESALVAVAVVRDELQEAPHLGFQFMQPRTRTPASYARYTHYIPLPKGCMVLWDGVHRRLYPQHMRFFVEPSREWSDLMPSGMYVQGVLHGTSMQSVYTLQRGDEWNPAMRFAVTDVVGLHVCERSWSERQEKLQAAFGRTLFENKVVSWPRPRAFRAADLPVLKIKHYRLDNSMSLLLIDPTCPYAIGRPSGATLSVAILEFMEARVRAVRPHLADVTLANGAHRTLACPVQLRVNDIVLVSSAQVEVLLERSAGSDAWDQAIFRYVHRV